MFFREIFLLTLDVAVILARFVDAKTNAKRADSKKQQFNIRVGEFRRHVKRTVIQKRVD